MWVGFAVVAVSVSLGATLDATVAYRDGYKEADDMWQCRVVSIGFAEWKVRNQNGRPEVGFVEIGDVSETGGER